MCVLVSQFCPDGCVRHSWWADQWRVYIGSVPSHPILATCHWRSIMEAKSGNISVNHVILYYFHGLLFDGVCSLLSALQGFYMNDLDSKGIFVACRHLVFSFHEICLLSILHPIFNTFYVSWHQSYNLHGWTAGCWKWFQENKNWELS